MHIKYDDDIKTVITKYEVKKTYPDKALLEVELITGRTHQIRAHLAYIGHPIIGDMVYGRKKPEKGLEGQCLHARELSFIHPKSGELITLTTPLPDYFVNVLSHLGEVIS